jgi:hypothetical protein
MNNGIVDNLVEAFNKNSIDFKFDSYIHGGKCILRGVFVYDHKSVDSLKKVLDGQILKNIKFLKTYNWYLGERKKVLLLKLKKEIELEIPEIEKYPVNNYS